MKIVVGLGNPGEKYVETKHNVGFWVVDELVDRLSLSFGQEKWKALVAEGRLGNERIVVLKPVTFMNLSGDSLAEVVHFFKEVDVTTDVFVVYDDMDFPPGVIKLRETGSAGGHNGVKSVISRLGTSQFPRIRVGIGRPLPERTVIDHVLTPFTPETRVRVEQAAKLAADAIVVAVEQGFSVAMNRFNTTA